MKTLTLNTQQLQRIIAALTVTAPSGGTSQNSMLMRDIEQQVGRIELDTQLARGLTRACVYDACEYAEIEPQALPSDLLAVIS